MLVSLANLLFYCCHKTPWPRKLVEGGIYLGLWFQRRRVHHHNRWKMQQQKITPARGASRELVSSTTDREQRLNWEWSMVSETSCSRIPYLTPPHPHSDLLHPAKPRLLNLSKWCHQLRTEYSNAGAYGEHVIQATTLSTGTINSNDGVSH